ncbi:Mdm2-binding protein [Larimichthys crocea]|uniref:Uncharacterized protein n=1 Tax=Larimichthys crocea TaxID=215358 RepID=A0ACD3QVV9_LARCR|nr:Mdm2-binding protein [Larimichthys crocea]
MDRYVLVISFTETDDGLVEDYKCLESVKQIYHRLVDISTQESVRGISLFPACSLSGSPSVQRWYFAIQACQGAMQVKLCWMYLVLGSAEQSPPIKDLLPLLGALKHMSCWHAAKITVLTQHTTGWQKAASYLSAGLVEPADLDRCIDCREVWRGGLVIREKKYVSELRFDGFSLRSPAHRIVGSSLLQASYITTDHKLQSEVFHYYTPVLDLVQLVNLSDLPSFLMSGTEFELSLSGKSTKAKLLLDQLEVTARKEGAVGNILCPLPCLQGDSLLKREKKVTQVQKLVLKEYLRQKGEASASTSIPVNDLKVILSQAREQYLKMIDSTLPSAATCLTDRQESTAGKNSGFQTVSHLQADWPERSVLHNIENLQRRRQKRRFGLLGPGSSDSLLGPKDSQKSSPALLDAKELLKHFTSDGLPTGELQPLAFTRGNNVFQLSPDLSPRRVSQMPFNKASASHYHGIEFCLDNQRSLDRDQAFVKLQSRLIRYETQTTCSKEPCALPFALSPAPSPAVMSEPGSVPDGETLQNADVTRLKRRSWDTDVIGGYPRKRLAKSESSESLCSQSSGSSGTHPAIRSLRQQPSRSQSTSSSNSPALSSAARRTSSGLASLASADKPKPQQQKTNHGETDDKSAKESRSQKHNRMLLEVVAKTLKQHGITAEHECFGACSKRLFDISKFYLKDLKTSRGLHDEMKKAASSNVKQVIDWVLEKTSKK